MPTKMVAGFLLLLLSLVSSVSTESAVSFDVTPAAASRYTDFSPSATVTKTLTFDLTRDTYTKLMAAVSREVRLTTIGLIENRAKLGKQKLSREPDTWIHIVFKGELSATVAIRADNLYIVGFKTNEGTWFAFNGEAHFLPAGAKELSFRSDYKGLTGGKTHKAMERVPVGMSATKDAASTLAKYTVGGPIPEDDVRKALATVVLTVCEGQRLAVVQNNVTALWAVGGTVSETGINLLVRWKEATCALLAWDETKTKTKKIWNDIPEATKIKGFGDPAMKDARATAANTLFILSATTCDKASP